MRRDNKEPKAPLRGPQRFRPASCCIRQLSRMRITARARRSTRQPEIFAHVSVLMRCASCSRGMGRTCALSVYRAKSKVAKICTQVWCILICVSCMHPHVCVVYASSCVCRVCILMCVSCVHPHVCVVCASSCVCRVCILMCVSCVHPHVCVVYASSCVCHVCILMCVSFVHPHVCVVCASSSVCHI
jgi:hypothetical protein